jgi:hypothetical protein
MVLEPVRTLLRVKPTGSAIVTDCANYPIQAADQQQISHFLLLG